jgi:hypothetical protein
VNYHWSCVDQSRTIAIEILPIQSGNRIDEYVDGC